MILTCPACHTKYVVKDGAIPPGGRQVRCAACKESWHQLPDAVEGAAEMPASDADDTVDGSASSGIAAEPVPDPETPPEPPVEPDEALRDDGVGGPPVAEAETGDGAQVIETEGYSGSPEDFSIAIRDDDEPRGRGPWVLVALVLLVAALAAAAWFLAPDSLRSRLGLAGAGGSPLELMVTTSDRQQLASGNELLAISGRVINPTGEQQAVPPIRAQLRNKATHKIVYQWTIAPPARSLPPGGSASFNSAEVDIPPGGDELTVTLASAAG